MIKKVLFYFFLFLSVFIFGCGGKQTDTTKKVSFGDYSLYIDKKFVYYSFSGNIKTLKDTELLYSFKKVSSNSFSDSLAIFRYKNDFPNSSEKFFSIIIDKFVKYIPGAKILETNNFSVKGAEVYYFMYEVNNNLFNNTDNFKTYYGLQAYIFTNKQEIYIISYISIDLESVKNILDAIKDLEFNKD